jgi:membrane protease YdiL (CAAX protease family)
MEAELDQPILSTPPRPTLRRLFLGDDGLRAGWSLLLFVIMFGVLIAGAHSAMLRLHLIHPTAANAANAEMTPRRTVVGEAVGFAALALAAFFMSLIERRPFGRYGLTATRALPDFAMGLLWGMTMLSVLIGCLLATHTIVFAGLALHGPLAFTFAAKWALVFLLVGLFEEFLFRGYIQYTVSRGVAGITRAMDIHNRHAHLIGFLVAAFIFSIVFFTLAHIGNQGETFEGIFAVALAGATFAFSLWRTGTLWWAIGFHTSWDWAQSYLYGTPDSGNLAAGHLLISHHQGSAFLSGGSAGPEGSIFVIPTLLLTALIIHFTLPRRTYPLTPDQSR